MKEEERMAVDTFSSLILQISLMKCGVGGLREVEGSWRSKGKQKERNVAELLVSDNQFFLWSVPRGRQRG